MGLLARIFSSPPERRDTMMGSDPYWANFQTMRVGSAAPSAYNVLSNLAVAARCIALRSELLASVPLFLFRRTADGGRERADDNALYGVLHDISNDRQSAFEFREWLVRNLDLHGNAFARIERNARGQVTALWPLMPGDVSIDRLATGRLRYRVYNGSRVETLLAEEMLHIRAATHDGIMGLSPIRIAAGALSLALSHQETAASLSHNALRPSAMVSFPGKLNAAQIEDFRRQTDQKLAGSANAGKLFITDGGAKLEQMSFTPEDAEFLQTRKLSNEDVARVFGLPPTSVGITDKATYSNTEQESRALVQNSLGPLAARIETAMGRCLLTEVGRRTLYIEHDLDGLLRGDVKSRYESYRIGREIGSLSPNDVRRFENEPPLGPEGDVYHMPANWMPLGGTPPGTSDLTRQ
jgi:HK97 family phage portal protein